MLLPTYHDGFKLILFMNNPQQSSIKEAIAIIEWEKKDILLSDLGAHPRTHFAMESTQMHS